MKEELERLSLLVGKEDLSLLSSKHVAIVGLGGVGGYVVDALSRAGIRIRLHASPPAAGSGSSPATENGLP